MTALTDRYRPARIKDFAGLKRAKAIMSRFVARPYPTAFFFQGDPGTGKTALALAVVAELGAELHHIPSSNCNLETVQRVCEACHYTPMFGSSGLHVVLVDEAPEMSMAAQNAFLSKLDATAFPPNTVFIFTGNEIKKLAPRFLSRCKVIEFDGQVDQTEASLFLYSVWYKEAGLNSNPPKLVTAMSQNGGNIRAALNDMELELMCLEAVAA